jgi:2-polyprenyl-3-methyl-5-hydroxy-6-metoxy-1,4-benzoquinol methylase
MSTSVTHYTSEFYDAQEEGSLRSAQRVLPLVLDALHPDSVLDVGCGVGTWTSVCSDAGLDVMGVDGDYVDIGRLRIPAESFVAADLTKPLDLGRGFDLVMSLEVAEHIAPEFAPVFVASLVRHAPVVLFSAAIPMQGGADHVNEQPPSYWARLFAAHGYRCIDAFRGRIWDEPAIETFYAQNLLLFVSEETTVEIDPAPPLDIVHPRMWEAGRPPTLRQIVKGLPDALRWSARFHLARLPGRSSR